MPDDVISGKLAADFAGDVAAMPQNGSVSGDFAVDSGKLAALRQRAENLAYGLGVALWLHPDGRIRIRPDEGEDGALWQRIDAPPGAAPIEGGHGRFAEAKAQP